MALQNKIDKLLTTATHDKNGIKCKFITTKEVISTDDLFVIGKLVRDFQLQLNTEILSAQQEINYFLSELNKKNGSRRSPISVRKLATEYPSAIPVVKLEKGSIVIELCISGAILGGFDIFTSGILSQLFGEAISRTPIYQKLVRLLSRPLFEKVDTELVEKTLERLSRKREWRRYHITIRKNDENTFQIEVDVIVEDEDI